MKRLFFLFVIISLLIIPSAGVYGQTLPNEFDMTGFPQWAQDLRRWDVITFGIFPFCLFFVSVTTDTIRWYQTNGLDFSDEGRRYAPWPLKSAGAYERTTDEHFRNIFIAAGFAASLALVDFAIVKIKQSKERQRIQNRPASSYNIERRPLNPPVEIEAADESDDESEADTDSSENGDG